LNRLITIVELWDSNKILLRLPKSGRLPREFVRLDPWETEYLFAAAKQATVGIVETGRFRGGSTLVMASAAPKIPLWSIDINPQDDRTLQQMMSTMQVGSCVELIIADSTTEVRGVGEFDLLWIDGDHSLAGCLGDITRWWSRLAPGGSMILHDCYLGSEVMDAVAAFMKERRDYLIVAGVVNGRGHYRSATGSLCHIRKLS
jgi:predicted O-methyltransferase YrrM